jgi:mRNA interferase MazF
MPFAPHEKTLPKAAFPKRGSVANVQGIGSLPTVRLPRRIGTHPTEAMSEIMNAIAWALELDFSDTSP